MNLLLSKSSRDDQMIPLFEWIPVIPIMYQADSKHMPDSKLYDE